MRSFRDVNGSPTATVATWVGLGIGWAVIVLLYLDTPLFPTPDVAIALSAFWFALMLFVGALYVLIQLVWSTRTTVPFIVLWLLPFLFLALGLAFARKWWS